MSDRTAAALKLLSPALRYGGTAVSAGIIIFMQSGLILGILTLINCWILATLCDAVSQLYRKQDEKDREDS